MRRRAHDVETWGHPENRKYITHHSADPGRLSRSTCVRSSYSCRGVSACVCVCVCVGVIEGRATASIDSDDRCRPALPLSWWQLSLSLSLSLCLSVESPSAIICCVVAAMINCIGTGSISTSWHRVRAGVKWPPASQPASQPRPRRVALDWS